VLDAHGDHAQALVWAGPGVLQNLLDHELDFGRGAIFLAGHARLLGDKHVLEAVFPGDAGEGGQGPVVQMQVGEGDEAFVAAAVVPGQHAHVRQRGESIQNGLVAGGEYQVRLLGLGVLRDHVGDGLALAGPRRALDDQILPA